MTTVRFVAATLWVWVVVVVWALHFAAIYGTTALACARGAPELVAPAIAWLTAAAAAALAMVLARAWRRRRVFDQWLAAALAAIALVAVVWEAVPALVVQPCV
jgi:hypothetical protein